MITTMDGPVYSLPDLARALGLNYGTAWARLRQGGTIPEPNVRVGRKSYYSADLYHRIVQTLGVSTTK